MNISSSYIYFSTLKSMHLWPFKFFCHFWSWNLWSEERYSRCTCSKKFKCPFMPVISLTSVIWIFDTYENNFGTNPEFTKYLKESWELDFDLYFSFKYFFGKLLLIEIYHQNSQVVLGSTGMNWLKLYKEEYSFQRGLRGEAQNKYHIWPNHHHYLNIHSQHYYHHYYYYYYHYYYYYYFYYYYHHHYYYYYNYYHYYYHNYHHHHHYYYYYNHHHHHHHHHHYYYHYYYYYYYHHYHYYHHQHFYYHYNY